MADLIESSGGTLTSKSKVAEANPNIFDVIPLQNTKILKRQVTSVGKNVEKLKTSYTAGGHVKWCSCFGK